MRRQGLSSLKHPVGTHLVMTWSAAWRCKRTRLISSIYTILHELCVALLMDTVIRQAPILRQGRWRDAIRFDLISG